MKRRLGKIKPLAFLLLILASTIVTFSLLPTVEAEITIISIFPYEGNVGETVEFIANISTVGGEYIIQFNGETVTSGNAIETDVNASFPVPQASAGIHNVMIVDVDAGENATTFFTVQTSHSLKVYVPKPPKQLQEGDNVTISANIDGGESGKTYTANITVQTPKNVSYTKMLNITTPENGSNSVNLTYTKDFPIEANTNYTGEYKVFYNDTLATEQFSVGLTNSSEYHRFESVDIKATGYEPNENVTITMTFGEKIIPPKQNVTATGGGIIYANWSVPSNASMGNYTVSVTGAPNMTKKDPPDIQNFTVPGFAINITTLNLAKEPVPNVIVQVFENVTSVVNATSDSEGLASLRLEIGIHACKAYFKDEKVGERLLNITKEASFDLCCNLTNLRILVIAVMDDIKVLIPEVKLYLTPEDQTLITDINGSTVFHSLLPNVTYALNASRYDKQFNTTTVPRLLVNETAIAWFNVTIICPTLTMQVNVTDANNQPISDATVNVQEMMGGLYYEGNTIDGIAVFNCPFGRYTVKIYASGVKINETVRDLFQNENVSVRCKLYGITVSIKVVDYFGQPIPNANVTLQRKGLQTRSNRTEYNGVATFSDFIGGSVQIAIYLNDRPCIETASSVDSSATIEIKIGKYILIAGSLVETSQLATASVIAAAIILVILVEVYRRKRLKSQKSSS